jgi:hypothetical protein
MNAKAFENIPFVATHIDISESASPEVELPWDEDITKAVEAGRISARRADKIQASRDQNPHVSYDRTIPGWVACNCPIGADHDKN